METDHLLRHLHARGSRLTPQRLAILRAVDSAEGHLSPSEIFALVSRTLPGITEATIYRTLDFLTEQGLILCAHMGSGRIVYQSIRHAHHHLVCRRCGDSVNLPEKMLRAAYREVQETYGYRMDASHTTLFGLCPKCQSL